MKSSTFGLGPRVEFCLLTISVTFQDKSSTIDIPCRYVAGEILEITLNKVERNSLASYPQMITLGYIKGKSSTIG